MKDYSEIKPESYDRQKKEEEKICNKCKYCFCIWFTMMWLLYMIAFFIVAITEDLFIYKKDNLLKDNSGSSYI